MVKVIARLLFLSISTSLTVITNPSALFLISFLFPFLPCIPVHFNFRATMKKSALGLRSVSFSLNPAHLCLDMESIRFSHSKTLIRRGSYGNQRGWGRVRQYSENWWKRTVVLFPSLINNSQIKCSWWNHIPTEFSWSLVVDFKDVASYCSFTLYLTQ